MWAGSRYAVSVPVWNVHVDVLSFSVCMQGARVFVCGRGVSQGVRMSVGVCVRCQGGGSTCTLASVQVCVFVCGFCAQICVCMCVCVCVHLC